MLQADPTQSSARSARFYAGVSIVAAVVTIALKAGAYLLTGSVGLFPDAAESGVNLVAAVGAFLALRTAARPPDEEHAYGHTKAEYFSSALESVLIIVAAIGIAVTDVTGMILSRQTAFEPEMVRAVLVACSRACRLCGEECEQHAQHGMEHCRICAEACRRCESACNNLVSAVA